MQYTCTHIFLTNLAKSEYYFPNIVKLVFKKIMKYFKDILGERNKIIFTAVCCTSDYVIDLS